MAAGLQIFDGNGTLAFDSKTAKGGVCLDIVMIPLGTNTDQTFNFPGAGTGYTPNVRDIFGQVVSYYSYSEANGYPSFTISWAYSGYGLALFVK